ncbi:MAG: RHS repeat protein, partial [Planctomycetes bacterium]|nr:RHS repeat protein [Planctomycetota bacterium]
PNGRWTRTERDGRGLVVRQIVGYGDDPETEYATTHFYYDANGNMIEQVDPEGNRTVYQYDNLDRLVQTLRGNKD